MILEREVKFVAYYRVAVVCLWCNIVGLDDINFMNSCLSNFLEET